MSSIVSLVDLICLGKNLIVSIKEETQDTKKINGFSFTHLQRNLLYLIYYGLFRRKEDTGTQMRFYNVLKVKHVTQ